MLSSNDTPLSQSLLSDYRGSEINVSLSVPPLSTTQLQELLTYLDTQLSTTGCNDTLRHTRVFANSRAVAFAPLQRWLSQHGGYCDCQVRTNVELKTGSLY